MPQPDSPDLVVVVPAHNEESRLPSSLASLEAQRGVRLRVMVSDNASTDGTALVAAAAGAGLAGTVRTVGPLGPSEHFVSCIRWALASPDGELFALLAGDDTWSDGFARAAVQLLAARPEINVVFPAFVWDDEGGERLLRPPSLAWRSPRLRQLVALALPDGRELSNLVYGVYRRAAFLDLAEAWDDGGDEYGADFAAAWSVIGSHRVAACEDAVGRRFVRSGADLLERIGFRRGDATGPIATVSLYLRLSLATNAALAKALRQVGDRRDRPRTWAVQLTRAPQIGWGAVAALRALVSRAR